MLAPKEDNLSPNFSYPLSIYSTPSIIDSPGAVRAATVAEAPARRSLIIKLAGFSLGDRKF